MSAGINAAQNLVNGIWNTICELPGKMLGIGQNIVEGLWNGISNVHNWILNKIGDFCNEIFNGIKGFFGIASPSKLFEEQIGKNLALGVGEGFTDSMKDVSRQMERAIPTDFDTDLKTSINYVSAEKDLYHSGEENNTGSNSQFVLENKKEVELLQNILNETHDINESLYTKFISALTNGVSFTVDNRELARLIRRYA